MAYPNLPDLVKIYATTTGTGAITLGEAVSSYRGVEALMDGGVYSYSIQQGGNYEVGQCTYLATARQIVRTPKYSSNDAAAVDLQPNAAIAFIALGEDLAMLAAASLTIDTEALAAEVARAGSVEAYLSNRVAAAAMGFYSYDTLAAMNADTTKPVGTFAINKADSNFYRYTSTGWVLDTSIATALASYVAPIVAAGIVNLTATGATDAITVSTPDGGFAESKLYRFTSPVTNVSTVTINGRPLQRPDGTAVAHPGTLAAGGEVFFTYRASGVVFKLFVAANTRVDDLTDLISSLDVVGLRDDVTITSDPYYPITQKIVRSAFGTITFANGARTVVKPTFIIASVGNSIMLGQGANNSATDNPGEQMRAIFQAMLPDWTVLHDNYAVAGSWCNQIGGQIAGFTRKPDMVLVGTPMNDGTANIFMGYEGFVGPNNTYGGYEGALQDVFNQIYALGDCIPVNISGNQPHPSRSKASGRFTVTPEVLMAWPVPSFLAYFVTLTYTTSDQRITSNLTGLFNTYSNGLLAVGSYLLEFDAVTGSAIAEHQVAEIDPAGTWVRVNGTITTNHTSVGGLRQSRFDNETQVWPPLTTVNGLGAIVQRDYSGTGAYVDVSWRHWELAKANRRVAANNRVVTIDTDTVFGRTILTNADYDTAFPGGEDYHSRVWYTLLPPLLKRFARDLINGTIPAGRIYS